MNGKFIYIGGTVGGLKHNGGRFDKLSEGVKGFISGGRAKPRTARQIVERKDAPHHHDFFL